MSRFKGQATRKKPWQQGETLPTNLQMEKCVRELRRISMYESLQFSD